MDQGQPRQVHVLRPQHLRIRSGVRDGGDLPVCVARQVRREGVRCQGGSRVGARVEAAEGPAAGDVQQRVPPERQRGGAATAGAAEHLDGVGVVGHGAGLLQAGPTAQEHAVHADHPAAHRGRLARHAARGGGAPRGRPDAPQLAADPRGADDGHRYGLGLPRHRLEVHAGLGPRAVQGRGEGILALPEPQVPRRRQAPLAREGRRRSVTGSRREGALGLALVLPPLLLVFLIVLPAITAVLDTLAPPPGASGLTLARYAQVLSARIVRADIAFSVVVTLVSVAAVFCLSYPLALYLRFAEGRLPAVLAVLFTIPLFVPVVIASFAMITFLVNHGLISTVLYHLGIQRFPPLVYNATGIVLTEVWASIPFAVLILGAGLQAIDDALIDSARDVGAGRL